MIVIERRQGMVGRERRGTVKRRSNTPEKTESLFMEGRADNSVDPEGLGVGILRQIGLKEDSGLSAQGRH